MNFAPTHEWEKIPIYNDSGEDIPPFACMGVKGGRVVNGITYLDVEKPSTTLRNQYLFNGAGTLYTASTRRYGIGYRGPLFLLKTSPTFGQGFGPKPGQWELELGFPLLALIDCVHIESGSTYIGYGEYRPFATLFGKAHTGGISARSGTTQGTGTLDIWYDNAGTLTDTTMTVTVKNLSIVAIASGEYVEAIWIENAWYVVEGGATPKLGKADAAIAKGSSGTISIWSGSPGSETDSTVNETALARFGDIVSGQWVWIANNGDGWYIVATDQHVSIGKTDSSVAAGASGTVSVWTGTPGSETDSGVDIASVRNRTSVAIGSAKWVRVEYINGNPYMEPWEC